MRKIYKKIPGLLLLLMGLLVAPTAVWAQSEDSSEANNSPVSYQEDFNYALGNLIDQDKWYRYGNNTEAPIQVVDKTLEYANYPGGVKGKCVQITPTASGEDLITRFTSNDDGLTEGYVYYSALIHVTQLPSSDESKAQNFVMALCPRTKASTVDGAASGKNFSSTELGRLFIVKADEEGKYKIGIDRGSNKAVFANGTFDLNTTQLVVVRYGIKTGESETPYDETAIFVNPTDFTKEPETPDATTDINTLGSQVGKYGLQGLEIRQGSNQTNSCAKMYIGSLRIAQSYAGLFNASSEGGDTPQPAKPAISVMKEVNMGATYVGMPISKEVTVKGKDLTGDITLEIAGNELTANPTTITKEEAESATGAKVTFTLNPTAETTGATEVVFKSEGAADVTSAFSWYAEPIIDCATIKEISEKNSELYETYRYTGEALVTFVDSSAATPAIYVEDETAAIVIKPETALTKLPAIGDKLTGFFGNIQSTWGMVSFIPSPLDTNLGKTLSSGNEIDPVVVTLSELKANAKTYVNALVRVNGVEFTTEATEFAEGMQQPVINDGTESGKLRVFKGTSLIGTSIPTTPVDIIGISTSASAVLVAPRGAEDIVAQEVGEPELNVTPTKFEMTAGKVGKTTEVGTIHISAKNMPGAITLEVTGANRAMFTTSVAEIKKGSSETDVVISYKPTAIGKHSGRLVIDCPEAPELSQSVSFSAYAIDEQNPPVISVEPETIPEFATKIGESQEQTITLTTAHLPDYAYVKLAKADVFRISSSMLMKDAKAQVKVTFVPLTAGSYENEIVVSALGTDTLRIPIKGVATDNVIPENPAEGDLLPLDASNPVKLLNETFDGGEKNKPFARKGWKNIALKGSRAWWSYTFNNTDASNGESVAKVTAYDSKVEDGEETPAQMMLVTPALDFKNAESKIFTFRVRGDYLTDNQADQLELCYIDLADDSMYVAPVSGFNMPCTKDESGEWFEYHIDLSDQNIADTFFMAFRFTSIRGRYNSATYYVDDVTFGRTDIPVIRPNVSDMAFTALPGLDAVSNEVEVVSENLTAPIKLSLGGPNKSKFALSVKELPAEGGSFFVKFNSDKVGVHEAYVKLASRGAADKYVVLSVNNNLNTGINEISADAADITVFSLNGTVVNQGKNITPAQAVKGLPVGTYIIQKFNGNRIDSYKVVVK